MTADYRRGFADGVCQTLETLIRVLGPSKIAIDPLEQAIAKIRETAAQFEVHAERAVSDSPDIPTTIVRDIGQDGIDRSRYVYEGPNGSPRPKSDVSPGEHLRGVPEAFYKLKEIQSVHPPVTIKTALPTDLDAVAARAFGHNRWRANLQTPETPMWNPHERCWEETDAQLRARIKGEAAVVLSTADMTEQLRIQQAWWSQQAGERV